MALTIKRFQWHTCIQHQNDQKLYAVSLKNDEDIWKYVDGTYLPQKLGRKVLWKMHDKTCITVGNIYNKPWWFYRIIIYVCILFVMYTNTKKLPVSTVVFEW